MYRFNSPQPECMDLIDQWPQPECMDLIDHSQNVLIKLTTARMYGFIRPQQNCMDLIYNKQNVWI